MSNDDAYSVHLLGLRSSERMVLKNFLGELERKHQVSFSLMSQVHDSAQIDAAIVNMDDISNQQEIDATLISYGSTIPCMLIYDKKQELLDAYQRRGFITLRRPINFPNVAEQLFNAVHIKSVRSDAVTPSNFKVLVVDDSASVRRDMLIKVGHSGVVIETANDAHEALERVAVNNYDLIFMDVLMPGNKDGYDACREIKLKHPDLPVVLLTSKHSIQSKIKGRVARCDQYITKPASRDTVDKVLETYLFS